MKILTVNKKASFDYHFLESYEAGLFLLGHEVKSIRLGQVNLKGAYISFKANENGVNEAYLVNCHIAKYKFSGDMDDYDPERPRKLLLKKSELNRLFSKGQEKGLTIVPIKLYTERAFIKLQLAVAKGKKMYDKREDLKKKDMDRQLRTLTKGSWG